MTALQTADIEEARPEDKRLALRQKSWAPFLMVEHPTFGLTAARVGDISREGLRLEMPVAIPCGEEIIIHPPADTELLRLRANIVRQKVVFVGEEPWYECGIQVGDTAAWRKHKWFLALRRSDDEEA